MGPLRKRHACQEVEGNAFCERIAVTIEDGEWLCVKHEEERRIIMEAFWGSCS